VRGTREGKLWNEFIALYRYFAYKMQIPAAFGRNSGDI